MSQLCYGAVHELELFGEGRKPLDRHVELHVAIGVLDVLDRVRELARQAAGLAQAQERVLRIECGDDGARSDFVAAFEPSPPVTAPSSIRNCSTCALKRTSPPYFSKTFWREEERVPMPPLGS